MTKKILEITKVDGGVPKGTILDELLFLIRISDFYHGLLSNVKLSDHDTSLFLITHEINGSASELNSELISKYSMPLCLISEIIHPS